MTRAAKLITALLVAAPLSLACGANEAPAPTKVVTPEVDASASEPAPSAQPVAQSVAQPAAPKITADAAVYEFGGIKPSDSVDHVFKIRNAGTADLKIERVQRT